MGRISCVFVLTALLFFSLVQEAPAQTQIIINKATNQLHFMQDGIVTRSFPVATGRHPSYTPEGNFTVVVKLVNPYYSKLGIPGGSPHNPLGARWLGLSLGGGGVYGIHGTNNPASIGTYASAGCIRMHNRDVIWLYDRVPLGTPVKITGGPRPAAPAPGPPPVNVVFGEHSITVPTVSGDSAGPPLLPLRPVFELLGYSVAWDSGTSTVLVKGTGHDIHISVPAGWVKTGADTFNLAGMRNTGGTTYGPLSLWQTTLPQWSVLWDAQTRTVSFNAQNDAVPPAGPASALPGTPGASPGG